VIYIYLFSHFGSISLASTSGLEVTRQPVSDRFSVPLLKQCMRIVIHVYCFLSLLTLLQQCQLHQLKLPLAPTPDLPLTPLPPPPPLLPLLPAFALKPLTYLHLRRRCPSRPWPPPTSKPRSKSPRCPAGLAPCCRRHPNVCRQHRTHHPLHRPSRLPKTRRH